MLTPKQVEVLGAFLLQPYRELSYVEIKRYTKGRSNSVVQSALAAFLEEGVVSKRLVGRIPVYKPVLSTPLTLAYFQVLVRRRFSKVVSRSLKLVSEGLAGVPFKSVVVFGSYAGGTQTEKSDLDIAVFVRTSDDVALCKSGLYAAKNKSLLELDAHVITAAEMKEMLLADYENLGKQIACKHLAVQNAEVFYSLLDEGSSHGFKIIY